MTGNSGNFWRFGTGAGEMEQSGGKMTGEVAVGGKWRKVEERGGNVEEKLRGNWRSHRPTGPAGPTCPAGPAGPTGPATQAQPPKPRYSAHPTHPTHGAHGTHPTRFIQSVHIVHCTCYTV
eukprot:gene16420-biopygen20281